MSIMFILFGLFALGVALFWFKEARDFEEYRPILTLCGLFDVAIAILMFLVAIGIIEQEIR